MHRQKQSIVINTSPILSIIAATGSLGVLTYLYSKVYVTKEVQNEILSNPSVGFGKKEFIDAALLTLSSHPLTIAPILQNSLDIGEASVIQFALNNEVGTVCIDEAVGRRVARLNNLSVTGSLGVLLKAKASGYNISIKESIQRMLDNGTFLSDSLINQAITMANE